MTRIPCSLDSFNRVLAASIKKPYELRYNPYTQSIEALSDSGKIKDLAKELRGDMFLISSAIKKIQVDYSDENNLATLDFKKWMQFILQGNTDEDITTMEDICDIMETKLSPEELWVLRGLLFQFEDS